MSEEEAEKEFLEEGFNLESPEADGKINYGTAAPNCQPKHTRREPPDSDGQEVVMEESAEDQAAIKHRRESTNSAHSASSANQQHRDKRQHVVANQQKQQQQLPPEQQRKKLSYIQMAKLGYQELINAIIRPPRADYKVLNI